MKTVLYGQKETYVCAKRLHRDLCMCGKRPMYVSKETYVYAKRDLCMCKETCERDALLSLTLQPHTHQESLLAVEWVDTAIRCNTLQHTVTHCNSLKHTATHCNSLQHTASHTSGIIIGSEVGQHCNTLQLTATHCNSLQLTATHCNSLQLTATHCITYIRNHHWK